jgi:hypothetical protein
MVVPVMTMEDRFGNTPEKSGVDDIVDPIKLSARGIKPAIFVLLVAP